MLLLERELKIKHLESQLSVLEDELKLLNEKIKISDGLNLSELLNEEKKLYMTGISILRELIKV